MQKNKLLNTFLELVKIDSPSGEENEIRNYISMRLSNLSIPSIVDTAGNLLARVPGEGDPILICAHMDTVEPGRGVKPIVESGVIKSDGTTILGADNKIAIAAILECMEEIKNESRKNLELLFTVREETDGGINEFDCSVLNSKIGLIADRSSQIGSIVLSSPWINNLEITIIGRAAHAGMPEKGINALMILSKTLNDLTLGRINENTTFNIGLISGGEAMNSVPEKIKLIGEVRSFSKENLDSQTEKVSELFKDKANRLGGKAIINIEKYCDGYVYDKNDLAISQVSRVFSKMEIETVFEKSFGGSDANTLISNGIMAVNIGDGGEDPHTLKESVTLENLEKIKDVFVNYIKL